MKANRKFLNNDDEAVSPVIAVILMVAITVVLAATVYVWVSGFGSNSSQPAKSAALTASGAIGNPDATHSWKNYTVASASPGLKYNDLSYTLDGSPLTFDDQSGGACAAMTTAGSISACRAGDGVAPSGIVAAGDTVALFDNEDMSGKALRLVDAASNSIILTLSVS